MFDGIAISMRVVAAIEAMSAAGLVQRRRPVEEERSITNVVLLPEFGEEIVSKSVVSGCFKVYMQQFVRMGIDRSAQPTALVIESDHGLGDHDVIRRPAGFGP